MRLGKKLKSGLKLGAKIGAGVIGAAGVVGAGLFALGSKASPSASTPSQDFMSGTGSIANVSTAELDNLYPAYGRPVFKADRPASVQQLITRPTTKPKIQTGGGIGSGLTQAQKDRDLALIKLLEADGV